jgi:hypothetical protein
MLKTCMNLISFAEEVHDLLQSFIGTARRADPAHGRPPFRTSLRRLSSGNIAANYTDQNPISGHLTPIESRSPPCHPEPQRRISRWPRSNSNSKRKGIGDGGVLWGDERSPFDFAQGRLSTRFGTMRRGAGGMGGGTWQMGAVGACRQIPHSPVPTRKKGVIAQRFRSPFPGTKLLQWC